MRKPGTAVPGGRKWTKLKSASADGTSFAMASFFEARALVAVEDFSQHSAHLEWPESSAFHSFSTVAFPAIPAPAKANGSLY